MAGRRTVFIGGYTEPILFGTGRMFEGRAEGIGVWDFDQADGSLQRRKTIKGIRNPSFLCYNQGNLLAVNECKDIPQPMGGIGGAVSSFRWDSANFALEQVSILPSGGGDPCHVALNKNGTLAMVSNYAEGRISCFGCDSAGRLSAGSIFQHVGGGPHPRQAGPHAHCVTFWPGQNAALAADLGCDRLMRYNLDNNGGVTPVGDGLSMPPGSGPRQMAFTRDGRHLYVVGELDGTISAIDSAGGVLRLIQTLAALPDDGAIHICADLKLSIDERTLYLSDKSRQTVSVYARESDGRLRPIGATPCGGENPRHMAIDPSGRWLLCANQDSDTVGVLAINPASGMPALHRIVDVPTPVCLAFAV